MTAPTINWTKCSDALPPDETPVLIVRKRDYDIGELRWDHPGHEDDYKSYRYWDHPRDDGRCWEFDEVTHWAPLMELPT